MAQLIISCARHVGGTLVVVYAKGRPNRLGSGTDLWVGWLVWGRRLAFCSLGVWVPRPPSAAWPRFFWSFLVVFLLVSGRLCLNACWFKEKYEADVRSSCAPEKKTGP